MRQSTAQQVLDHQESTRLQYGLVERARALGWAADRVLVIDQDLGHSAASATDRVGFQRLVSEVSLDPVGLILGLEMSRLARSNTEWYQLLELCALFGTLIADLDGVYDPAPYNDRLLLGLKGTLSEAELPVLLMPKIVAVEHGLCGCVSEFAEAGAEGGEDGRSGDAAGFGELVAVGAGDLVDQSVGTQQAEFAADPG